MSTQTIKSQNFTFEIKPQQNLSDVLIIKATDDKNQQSNFINQQITKDQKYEAFLVALKEENLPQIANKFIINDEQSVLLIKVQIKYDYMPLVEHEFKLFREQGEFKESVKKFSDQKGKNLSQQVQEIEQQIENLQIQVQSLQDVNKNENLCVQKDSYTNQNEKKDTLANFGKISNGKYILSIGFNYASEPNYTQFKLQLFQDGKAMNCIPNSTMLCYNQNGGTYPLPYSYEFFVQIEKPGQQLSEVKLITWGNGSYPLSLQQFSARLQLIIE